MAWYRSDTTFTIQHLGQGLIDAGITYSAMADAVAIDEGIARAPAHYAFRDHFALVGPTDNPARLNGSASAVAIFAKLFAAAEARDGGRADVRFLSRFDKSATNLKESHMWTSVGQVRGERKREMSEREMKHVQRGRDETCSTRERRPTS